MATYAAHIDAGTVEHLDFIAETWARMVDALDSGGLDRAGWDRTFFALDGAYRAELDGIDAPADCPDWCNDHLTSGCLDGEGVESNHRHTVQLLGSTLEVEDNDDGRTVILPQTHECTVAQARALAAAILAACNAVDTASPAAP
ncbi:MAG: hypothetical protein ABIU87_05095 [Ornithinibacter sp.]